MGSDTDGGTAFHCLVSTGNLNDLPQEIGNGRRSCVKDLEALLLLLLVVLIILCIARPQSITVLVQLPAGSIEKSQPRTVSQPIAAQVRHHGFAST